MSTMMHSTRRQALLQSVETPKPLKANPPLQDLEKAEGGRLLRKAIANAGLTPKEASYLCGVSDAAQFNRMLDGLEKLWVHVLLRKAARPILHELLIIVAVEQGTCQVERTIRIKETA
jgi:hypothetical protein